MSLSLIGSFFSKLEMNLIQNCKLFVGRHEKTVEVVFLIIYFSLQAFLVFLVREAIVALIVISFLLFLSLERIFVHIWLDHERKQIKKEEDILREVYNDLRVISNGEISKLKKEIEILTKENKQLKNKG